MKKRNVYLAIAIFVFVAFLLTIVQLRTTERPLLLMERFFRHGGWIEVILIAAYGAFLGYQMSDPSHTPRYRRLSWMLFSIVFFSQFILGLLVDTIFFDDGKIAFAHTHDGIGRPHISRAVVGNVVTFSQYNNSYRPGMVQPILLFWCNGWYGISWT